MLPKNTRVDELKYETLASRYSKTCGKYPLYHNFKISPNTASDSSSRSRSLSEAEYYINNMPTSQRKLVEDYLLMRSLKNNTDPISINTLSIQQLMEIIVEVEQQYLSRSY